MKLNATRKTYLSRLKCFNFSALFNSEKFKQKLLNVFLLCCFGFLAIACLLVLRWNGIFLIILLLINIFIYVSYRYNVSIPGISKLSSHYIKKSTQGFSKLNSSYFRFKFLYYLILLIHDIDSGFGLLFDNAKPLGIEFSAFTKSGRLATGKKEAMKVKVREEYLKEALWAHHLKKKKATIASMISSSALTVIILVLTIIFAQHSLAATYGWVQTDWSEGASTSSNPVHPDGQSGWKKFNTSTNITMIDGGTSFQIATSTSSSTDGGALTTSTDNNFTTGGGFGNGALSGLTNFGSGAYSYLANSRSVADFFNATSSLSTNIMSMDYDSDHNVYWGLRFDNPNYTLKGIDPETMAVVTSTTGVTGTGGKIVYESNGSGNLWAAATTQIKKYHATSSIVIGQVGSTVTVTNGTGIIDYDSNQDVLWTLRTTGSGML